MRDNYKDDDSSESEKSHGRSPSSTTRKRRPERHYDARRRSRDKFHLRMPDNDNEHSSGNRRTHDNEDDHDTANDRDEAGEDNFITNNQKYYNHDDEFHHARRQSLSSPNQQHRRRGGHIFTSSSTKESPKDLYQQIRMYIKRSKVPKRNRKKILLHKRNHIHLKNNKKRSKMTSSKTVHSRDKISRNINKTLSKKTINTPPASKPGNITTRNKVSPTTEERLVSGETPPASKPGNITTRNKVSPTTEERLVSGETPPASKPANITTRNKVSPTREDRLVSGETEANFGTQFSEPHHSESNNDGNNGYSRGEYFGPDTPDTGDNTVSSLISGETHDAAAFLANDNGAALAKSFVGNDIGGADHSGVLLDSERIEGFEHHHHHDNSHMMGQHHSSGKCELCKQKSILEVHHRMNIISSIIIHICNITSKTVYY